MTLAELRALHEKATAAPWFQWVAHGSVRQGTPKENDRGHVLGGGPELADTDRINDVPMPECLANAALIVALRNAAPALLRVAEAAKVVIDECYAGTTHPASVDGAMLSLASLDAALSELDRA